MDEHKEAVEAFLRVFDERLESEPLAGAERRQGSDRRQAALEDAPPAPQDSAHEVSARRARGLSDPRDFAYWVEPREG